MRKSDIATYDPEERDKQESRRLKLREWIQRAGGTTVVAEQSGLNRVYIEKLIASPSGSASSYRDMLGMRADTIEKLLTALGVSDSRAQVELQIPERLHSRWRTLRPAPLGSGAPLEQQYVEVVADRPIHLTIEPGHTLQIDPNHTESGSILVRSNDHYLILPADAVPSGAESLGQLVAVHTLVRRKVP